MTRPPAGSSRLMATGAEPASLARKIARQNAAELAALTEGPGPEHIAAFAASARAYAERLPAVWDLPHHCYRDTEVTVGGMAGAACAEWHLHAWDLARALGQGLLPGQPGTAGGRLAGRHAAAAARRPARGGRRRCFRGPAAR